MNVTPIYETLSFSCAQITPVLGLRHYALWTALEDWENKGLHCCSLKQSCGTRWRDPADFCAMKEMTFMLL